MYLFEMNHNKDTTITKIIKQINGHTLHGLSLQSHVLQPSTNTFPNGHSLQPRPRQSSTDTSVSYIINSINYRIKATGRGIWTHPFYSNICNR